MSILFIALQCFKCSTMQVKQQRKSSNKWTCVVCNEKQSVRKVYARGYQAKDVRKFVQGFNGSKSMEGRSDGAGWIGIDRPRPDRSGAGGSKRMDWTEYLDEEREDGEDEDEDEGVLITTEMPAVKFGRQCANRTKCLKPYFPKKRINSSTQGNSGSSKCQRTTMQKEPSKWSKYMEKEEDEDVRYKFDGDEDELSGVNESMLNGLVVEEEVHPDFI